jgi:DNA-binding response OmpR family regulator
MVQQIDKGPERTTGGGGPAVPKAVHHRSATVRHRLVEQTTQLLVTRQTLEERLAACFRTVQELARTAPGLAQGMRNGAATGSANGGAAHPTSTSPWRSDQRLILGTLEVVPMRQTVLNGSREHRLTPTEWQLLGHLMAHPGEILSRADLAIGAWGPGFAGRASEVEVYISRLRKKLQSHDDDRLIETVRGRGYRLTAVPRVPLPEAAS